MHEKEDLISNPLEGKTDKQTSSSSAQKNGSFLPLHVWQTEQRRDPDLKTWFDAATVNGDTPEGRFTVQDGILRRQWLSHRSRRPQESLDQLVVPRSLRSDILLQTHEDVLSGHQGVLSMLERLRPRFWWPAMKRDVLFWVASCVNCQSKHSYQSQHVGKLLGIPVVPVPFHTIGIDLVGPLPATNGAQNRHLLVMTDYFTKWPEAVAIQTADSDTVARAFLEFIICRHGAPQRLISDRGKVFLSKIMTSLYDLLGVKKVTSTSYHPQLDGATERANRQIMTIVSKYVASNQRDWDRYVATALWVMRTSIHNSTRMSPFEMVYGRKPTLTIDAVIQASTIPYKSAADYVRDTAQKIANLFDLAQSNIELAQFRQQQHYDRDRTDILYFPGERVWIHVPHVKTGNVAKLTRQWVGPYMVTERTSPVNYRIARFNTATSKINPVVHVSRMKRFIDPAEREWIAPIDDNDEDNLDWTAAQVPSIDDTVSTNVSASSPSPTPSSALPAKPPQPQPVSWRARFPSTVVDGIA